MHKRLYHPFAIVLCLLMVWQNCYTQQPCNVGTYKKESFFSRGINQPIPKGSPKQKGFYILVDTTIQSKTFKYAGTKALRRSAKYSAELRRMELDGEMPRKQFRQFAKDKFEEFKKDNIKNQQHKGVYLINRSFKTINIQVQGGSYIGIIEALDKDSIWKPITYWTYSWCSHSYKTHRIKPFTAGVAKIYLPKTGNFKTQLRCKFTTGKELIYSNTFWCYIDECSFINEPGAEQNGGNSSLSKP